MAFLLELRQRRKLGLTQRNVRRILKEMKADGEFEGMTLNELRADRASIALSVSEKLRSDNPEAFCDAEAGASDRDWDKFFEFLEKLLTLLLPLIVKV